MVKCTPTISILGTELKLAETFRVDIKQLCQDLSLDIIKYMNPSATPDDLAGFGLEAPMSLASGYEDPGYWCPLTDSVECHQPVFQLEQDAPGSLVPAGMGVEVVEPQADNQDDQTSRLFPNALRISGLKHVCDNLCGSILAGLPQLLGCSRGICARTLGTQHIFCFESSCHHHQKNVECLLAFNTCVPRWSALLPQLQSLDIMLSSITWRERFVALCFSECTMQDRNKVLKWSGESLTGLRWQVVSAFCREAI